MDKNKSLFILELVIAIILGFILIRLFKGQWVSANVVYHRFTWLLLTPVFWLRNLNNTIVIIIGYCLIWTYIGWCKASIILDRLTFFFTGFWAIIGLLPFIPSGFSVFSLAVFGMSRISLFSMIVLYMILMSAYFLIFRFYFGQRSWLSGWWTLLITLSIIILNTVSSLSPQLVSQPFLNSLNYSTHRFINIISSYPIATFLFCIIIFYVSLRYIRYNFIAGKKRVHHFPFWITPSIITVILAIWFSILNNDLLRYRKFDYQQGINTAYMSKLENHVMTWCNNRHFGFLLNSVKLIYPFTMESLSDSLLRHSSRLSRLTIIEGLDFFRYERILNILAYGSRDTMLYKKIKPILKNSYYLPASIRSCIEDIFARYESNAGDIMVTGTVEINGNPLSRTRYQVTLFSGSISLPVWMAKTAEDGSFTFNCYNPDSLSTYVNIHLLLPDSVLHGRIMSIELVNLPPPIRQSGKYQLDTFKININKNREEIKIFEVHVYAQSALSGCRFALPQDYSVPTRINGRTSDRGAMLDIEYFSPDRDRTDVVYNELRGQVKNWRFYSIERVENQIEVYLNYNRN